MKRKNLSLFFITLLISLLASCRDELSTAGGKWVESSLRTIQTDTCTVRLSTILSDSLATSGDTVCQIGTIDDPVWGKIKAAFYAEYDVPTVSFSENADYRFDSITIRFYSSGNYLGDTLSPQRISLHSLSENLSLDEGYLYTTSKVSYHSTPLASFTFTPTPGETIREHEIRLPDEWGVEWFEHFQAGSREMESQEYFRDYFKGIAFIPEEGGNCVNGFMVNDSSLCITLYYHQTETDATELSADFLPNSDLRFNQVSCDRSRTALSSLQSGLNNGLPSEKSEHQSYLQGLTGMYINIDFPFLNDLRAEGRLVTIESALLRLYPVKGTYGEQYPLPESLTLYTADENNVTEDVVTDISGSSVQTGSLVTDEMMGEDTYYSFDITSFLQSNLGTVGYNRKILQLMLPDNLFFTTLNGVVFGDARHPDSNPVKLTLLYKTYNP